MKWATPAEMFPGWLSDPYATNFDVPSIVK